MRTLFSKTLATAMIMIAGLFVSANLRAQVVNPYPVNNHLPCPIDVRLDVYKSNIQGGSTAPCAFQNSTSTVIPPGGSITFPLGSGMIVCDIVVTVTAIDGISIAPVSASLSAPPASGPGAACAPIVTVNVGPGGADVN